MRAVIQRVKSASVSVDGKVVGEIGKGILAYVGVEKGDVEADLRFISSKIASLRIFGDSEGRMNLSVKDIGGSVLVISQFTLLGDCTKGRRPSFDRAESPGEAKVLYERVAVALREEGLKVETGEFQAHMEVESVNDGPVTFILESRKGE
ncbi:MAG: D-tyrosyl-tRNA(Tyr) deacylase [Deltaproteobacteria bacterium]|nr:D-tyrosyl-tRNA(Tyr) deacylase [Deltaproteobacteria bacterium]